jgi:Neprosin
MAAKNTSPDVSAWLRQRQRGLTITTSTTTSSRQTIDWVPIDSQVTGRVAEPPPALEAATPRDQQRPTAMAEFEAIEPGPADHVPVLRPHLAGVRDLEHLRRRQAKRGGLRVNMNRPNRAPADPDPAGYFHALSSQSKSAYGADAWLNVWDPAVDVPSSPGDDHSISQTWLQSYANPQTQSLEAGLTVDNGLNGDAANHVFTYYTTNGYQSDGNGLGGYNRIYSGWVQYHPWIFPGIRVNGSSALGGTQLELAIKYQLWQGNWWFGVNNDESGPWIWIGYYPTTLFNGGISDHADWVAFGGEVYSALADPCTTTDQMGSGRQGGDGWTQACYQRLIHLQESLVNGDMIDYNGTPSVDAAASTCASDPYTIDASMLSGSNWGSYQFFGGPSA